MTQTRTCFVLISGRPNVGKSTLLNAILGEKIAIVSRKPQTTRNKITGILTRGDDQIVFIDTPGLHQPKTLLGSYMMKAAGAGSNDNDVVLFVVEAGKRLGPAEREALSGFASSGVDVILVINKTDICNKAHLAEQISIISHEYEFKAIVPISALNGDGVDIILDEIEPYLAESPHFFPDDIATSQPERQLVSEIIREKVLRLTDDEIPHGVAVVVEDFKESKGKISIRAEIFCEKEGHKRILIGKNGTMLKKIGTYAREDMEKFFGVTIYLDLWVKVKENWRDRPAFLNEFGYNKNDLS